MTARRDLGFTLVEVMIVVVVMAILAAVIVPQFASSTEDAKSSTAKINARSMRTLIQRYKLEHNGLNPVHDPAAKTLTVLLRKTTPTGTIDAAAGAHGPYLATFPENPYTGVKDVKIINNDPPTDADVTGNNSGGWLFNATSGNIWLDSNPGHTY